MLYTLEHSTIDKVGCEKLKAGKYEGEEYECQWIEAIRFSEYSKQFLELCVNKFGVLAKFVFSQALLYLFKLYWQIALVIESFSRTCDKVCAPLRIKTF